MDPVVFKVQYIAPLVAFTFNKSPLVLSEIKSPSFEIAKANKFCDFIKDDTDRTSQILLPLLASKQRSLLSWLITKILSLKTFKLDFSGIP